MEGINWILLINKKEAKKLDYYAKIGGKIKEKICPQGSVPRG
jgi:hypothetical protein